MCIVIFMQCAQLKMFLVYSLPDEKEKNITDSHLISVVHTLNRGS